MTTWINPQITTEHTADGLLSMNIYDINGGVITPIAEILLTPDRIRKFMDQAVSQSLYAWDTVEKSLATGVCETCENHYLVDEDRNGRPWSVRCPECGDRQTNRSVSDRIAECTPNMITHFAYGEEWARPTE